MDTDIYRLFHQDILGPEPFSSWTLRVENLGKLQPAELQIRPLMLLVGENNTGKTYLATILYGIFRELDRLFADTVPTSSNYEVCSTWVRTLLTSKLISTTLQIEDCDPFICWLNEVLSENSSELLAHAFNHEVSQETHVEIRDFTLLRTPKVDIRTSQSDGDSDPYFLEMEGAFLSLGTDDLDLDPESVYQIVRFIALRLVHIGHTETVYLPASRTGIVQLYQEVQLRSIDRRRIRPRKAEPTAKLTPPVLDMIDDLTRADPENTSRFADEARDLESYCLQGSVEHEDVPGGGYLYRASASVSLPMALSSAVVTELVPIILTLRHKLYLGLLILDEPEAHLHPKLQRLLAQIIVRLVRKGLRVCLTTHSENFCQQLNNFIKLGALSDPSTRARDLGYLGDTYLKSDEVVGYEFKNRGAYAEMHRLPQSPTGISMPLFNDELLKLSEETLKLQAMLAREADAT